MAQFSYPNETPEYRQKRDALLAAEKDLRAHVESVAALRRQLPLGGAVDRNYTFARQTPSSDLQHRSLQHYSLADLFGSHDTLLIYSMMFGAAWDAPCPSCTSLVDGFNISWLTVNEAVAFVVVAEATPEQLHSWQKQRRWHIPLYSESGQYLRDYAGFPDANDAALVSAMNVFKKTADGIFHFWGSELSGHPQEDGQPRHVDMVWPIWNLLDYTPGGRGDIAVPKQDFEHRYFSEHVLGPMED